MTESKIVQVVRDDGKPFDLSISLDEWRAGITRAMLEAHGMSPSVCLVCGVWGVS